MWALKSLCWGHLQFSMWGFLYVLVSAPNFGFSGIFSGLFGNPPTWHRGLPGPSGTVQKESERVSRGLRPRGAPEYPKSAKRDQKRSLGLFSDFRAHSLGTLGPKAPGHPFGIFLDSFRVPGRKGPADLCARPGGSQGLLFLEVSKRHSPKGHHQKTANWT